MTLQRLIIAILLLVFAIAQDVPSETPTTIPSEQPTITPSILSPTVFNFNFNISVPSISPTSAGGNGGNEGNENTPETPQETTIYTIAGTGVMGNETDNVMSSSSNVVYPAAIVVDPSSNIHFVSSDAKIRKIDYSTGIISTTIIKYDTFGIRQIDIDNVGDIYWAERNYTSGNNATSTVNKYSFSQGGTSQLFSLSNVSGLAVDSNNYVYAADIVHGIIYKNNGVDDNKEVFAGSEFSGYGGDGGPATSAFIGFCNFMHFDSSNNLYFADVQYNVVRKVSSEGIISTVAGTGDISGSYNGDDIPATSATLNSPLDVATDLAGNVYITDFGNNRVRKVDAVTGVISTLVGDGNATSSGDGGSSTSASVNGPYSLEMDVNTNNLYVTELNGHRIRVVTNVDKTFTAPSSSSTSSAFTPTREPTSRRNSATFAPSNVHTVTFSLYLSLDSWPYSYVTDSVHKALTGLFKDVSSHEDISLDYSIAASTATRARDRRILSTYTLDITANVTALSSKISSISSNFVSGIKSKAQLVNKLNTACGCTDYSSITISFYGGEEYCVDADTPSAATCSYGKVKINPSISSIQDSAFYDQQLTGVDFGGKTYSLSLLAVISPHSPCFLLECDTLTSIGKSAFEQNEIAGTLDLLACQHLHTIDAYAFQENNIHRVLIPQSVQAVKKGAFLSNPIELLYCEERVDTLIHVIREGFDGKVIGCYGYSVDYFLFTYVYIKQYEFHVMWALIALYLLASCVTIMGSRSYSLAFQVVSVLASVDILSNIMYFLFSYFLTRELFWVSFVFAICIPFLAFIAAVLLRYRLAPHLLYEYYIGRIISRRFKVNALWIWLSHERGSPLINNKRQAFTFTHHDSIPKVMVYVISWLILLSLQLMSLSLFIVWVLLLSPYYLAVIAMGSFLYFTGLLAHGTVWNYWVWFYSGKYRIYSKSVTYDTRILNEAMCVQFACISVPLFIVKVLNMEVVRIYNEMDTYATRWWCGYMSVFVSAAIILLGLYRYVFYTLRYHTHIKDVPFTIVFDGNKKRQSVIGLQLSSEDIRYNSNAEERYKRQWQEKIIHSKLQHTMLDLMNLVAKVFLKDQDFGVMIEQLLQKRAMLVESIRGAVERSMTTESGATRHNLDAIAHQAFELLTQDSVDLTLYRLLKEIHIHQPSDLLRIKSHTISRLLAVIRNKSKYELISRYLNLLSYFNPRRTSLIVFKQPNATAIRSNQVTDIESNGDEALYSTAMVVDSVSVHPASPESNNIRTAVPTNTVTR